METKKDLPKPEKHPASRKKNRNPAILLASIALLFAVLAAGELGFHENEISKHMHVLRAQDEQSQLVINQLQHTVAVTDRQLHEQQLALSQLQQKTSGKQNVWILAEVNYLVNQANYHVRFDRDVAAAIALLQAADQRLAVLEDPKLLDLRQSLTRAITDLQTVPSVDVPGILLKINALQEKAEQLPLRLPTSLAEKAAIISASKLTWQQALQSTWRTLKQLVVIRRVDQPISPLLSIEQQVYLQQNLQILLQQAAFAALRNQNTVYQNSLLQAKTLIQRYYTLDAPITQAVMQQLNQLRTINVTPVLPDLMDLIRALQTVKEGA